MTVRKTSWARRSVESILAAALIWAFAATVHATETPRQWQWDDVSRVVAFGDVHGAYDKLELLLRSSGIIDEENRWSGGTAHIVSLGDVVDRGPDSRKVFDLLMRLEDEAIEAGGRVHLVLGNHEVMNLVGDLRYVSREEYAAFSDEESAADREAAWERFRRGADSGTPATELRSEFDQKYPPGFFGFLAAFSPEGPYGSWLLERQVVIRINDTAFAHAGLPQVVADLGGTELNRIVVEQVREYLTVVRELEQFGVLSPETGYSERDEAVQKMLESANGEPPEPRLLALGQRYVGTEETLAFLPDGPLWYRGTADHPETSERPIVDAALATLDADRVALGHTSTSDGRIHHRFEGRVLLIDTGMLEAVYRGRPSSLILEAGQARAFYPEEGVTEDLPAPSSAQSVAGAGESRMTDAELEEFLTSAEVVSVEEVGSGVTRPLRVTLRRADTELRAVFKSGDTIIGSVSDPRSLASINLTDRWTYDVAAYRLDRMLGLGMVPVAIRRTIEGKEGALQVWVEEAIDEKDRRSEGLAPADEKILEDQLQAMYAFDVLIYNEDRHAGNMLYTRPDWKLHLIDHTRSFRTKSGRPDALRKVELLPSPALVDALAALDKKELREVMGDLLHAVQVTALLKRRDRMIKDLEKRGLPLETAGAAP